MINDRRGIWRRAFLVVTMLSMTLSMTSMAAPHAAAPQAPQGKFTVTILQVADLHGQTKPHTELFIENGKIVFREVGGLAHIKTLIEQERAANPGHTIVLDGGDLFMGDGYSAKSRGESMIEPIKLLGYDFIVPGNWAVVYGKEQMIKLETSMSANPIVENMYHADTLQPIYPATWIKDIDGVRFGFMGFNDPDVPLRQNPQMSEGLEFTNVDARFKNRVDAFVNGNGIDVMFLVSHIGVFKQIGIADSPIAENIDYVLGNDTHERIRVPFARRNAKVTEPGAFGSFVGKLELDFVDGKLVGDRYELLEVDPTRYPADAGVQAAIERAEAPFRDDMERVIGHTSTPIYRYMTVESPMDNMITDAIRWKTGTQIALSNGFRYGNPIVPENGKPAPITMANLFNMLPLNTQLKTGRISGARLKAWMENEINNAFSPDPSQRFGGYLVRFSGMELRFEPSRPRGDRILSLKVGGKPVSADASYTIAAPVQTGAPEHSFNRLPNVEDVNIREYRLHDALTGYLAEFDPVAPKLDGRALSQELGTESFSTIPGTNYQFR
ncbi:bifunctional metallophosphatase/5'-nucleotidase [Luteimonas mephitis]|uniref:bifunctional metallophosphatase/5'-nucleotidase n=1 Tax=Luteimonas mephitis TaxID=83615 RepID=UPI0004217AEB|nr:5'-nucleotidase C-terminal domain-containing protein [Luteimonas mephitis]